jgi:hypothetical protein
VLQVCLLGGAAYQQAPMRGVGEIPPPTETKARDVRDIKEQDAEVEMQPLVKGGDASIPEVVEV